MAGRHAEWIALLRRRCVCPRTDHRQRSPLLDAPSL